MTYHIEYAKHGRAKCKGLLNQCPTSNRVIASGVLRLGIDSERPGMPLIVWRHWTCVSPQEIQEMKKSLGDLSALDGFDALRAEDAKLVQKAWEDNGLSETAASQEKTDEVPVENLLVASDKNKTPEPCEQDEAKQEQVNADQVKDVQPPKEEDNANEKKEKKPKKVNRMKLATADTNGSERRVTRSSSRLLKTGDASTGQKKRKEAEESTESNAAPKRRRGKAV